MVIKKGILIFSLIGCFCSPSVCGNTYDPLFPPANPIAKSDNKPNHSIFTSSEAITIFSLTAGSTVWVFDESGRNIYNKTIKNEVITIPIRSKGMYIVRVKTDNKVFTSKIFIK